MRSMFLVIFTFLLFFSGCGGENENDCNYEVSHALDKGEYDTVINLLDEDKQNKQCGFSEDEKNLNLAAAYIGKAGLTIVDIVDNMLKSDNSGGDGFASFVDIMSNDDSAENMLHFNNAKKYYEKIQGNCSESTNSSNLFKDSCFYRGLMQISQSANSISLIFGGSDEVTKWQDGVDENGTDDRNGNGQADTIDATIRAIDYASNGDANITNGITTQIENNVTFTKKTINYTYELIKISVGTPNPNVYYKLIDHNTSSPVITDKSCEVDFKSCSEENNTTCFPCPIIDSGKTMNVNDQLVDVINNGLDNIIDIGSGGDDGVGKSSDDYKRELIGCKGQTKEACPDRNVTLDDISKFLNKKD